MCKKKIEKILRISIIVLGTSFGVLKIIAKKKKGNSVYDNEPEQKNPLAGKNIIFIEDDSDKENADGVKGHLKAIGDSECHSGFYDLYVKRVIDIILSFIGLVVLSPVYLGIAIAIKIDDPGPVFFTQKRIGRNKKYFKLHKFRTMKMSTPHDVPTHMLKNPEQYITKVGKFLRIHSLDELPQIWDIFIGNMSIIGPRPGLWNQDVLTAERDKYGANDVKPGLTGWAQINGRDELEIPIKAKLDGEYVQKESLFFDIKCFLGTIGKIAKDNSVVEGGTGQTKKKGRHYTDGKSAEELIGQIGFDGPVTVDLALHRKVLITGAGSYIGERFKTYAEKNYGKNLTIHVVDMLDSAWQDTDFSVYDIVYHVAGIAHADVGNVSDEQKANYYSVNTDLAIEVCKKAKESGVKTFIFMSSMIVYGESAGYGKKKVIDRNTIPVPANFYGDSKLQADVAVRELADEKFKVVVLRPPMIYGRGSKGNYQILAKLAKKLPVFPNVNNERSMIYIDNFCEFLCQIMLVESKEKAVVLIPQNGEWTQTSKMAEEIGKASGKRIRRWNILNPVVLIGSKIPGKLGRLVNKAFGNMIYDQSISRYDGIDYNALSLQKSIKKEEGTVDKKECKPKALMLASVASMIDQFNMNNIQILLRQGYDVDVIADFVDGGTITSERIEQLKEHLKKMNVSIYHVPIPRRITNIKGVFYSYKKVKKMCNSQKYKLVHCHSPIGGVIARMAAKNIRKKYHTKVIYTAHGFHFYKGAPKKNWILFYPIEKFCSKYTDILITINEEDFERAKKHFHTPKTVYIPGVGIDMEKFRCGLINAEDKRAELGVMTDEFMLLSVGELSARKNHEVVIKALAKLNNPRIKYFIVGKGGLKDYLISLIKKYKLDSRVFLLGYRTDVSELCQAADLFIFPSHQEGLPVALMEAMACQLPAICSNIRGNKDLIRNHSCMFNENSVDSVVECLRYKLGNMTRKEFSDYTKDFVKEEYGYLYKFDITAIEKQMDAVYQI